MAIKNLKNELEILAIDPGLKGALVFIKGDQLVTHLMPLKGDKKLKTERVDFEGVYKIVIKYPKAILVCERAKPMSMGSKYAFSYGRDFEAVLIACELAKCLPILVEPSIWAKEIYKDISNDLKPKAKAVIAFDRICKTWKDKIPKLKNGNYHDGVVDACLIGRYAQYMLPIIEGVSKDLTVKKKGKKKK